MAVVAEDVGVPSLGGENHIEKAFLRTLLTRRKQVIPAVNPLGMSTLALSKLVDVIEITDASWHFGKHLHN